MRARATSRASTRPDGRSRGRSCTWRTRCCTRTLRAPTPSGGGTERPGRDRPEHVARRAGDRRSEEDAAAARRVDGALNRWFLDPVFGRGYPEDLREWYGFEGEPPKPAPPDVIGVNYYFRQLVRAEPGSSLGAVQVEPEGVPKTDMGWEIHPDGLRDVLVRVRDEYSRRCSP